MQAKNGKTGEVFYHDPVLLDESLECLLTDPNGVYVDCTLGGGGHSQAILQHLGEKGRLIAIDRDAEAIAHAKERIGKDEQRVEYVQQTFEFIKEIFESLNIKNVDGILMDFGLSSRQIDAADRGFSYMQNGPLDMRMNQEGEGLTAADVVNTYSEAELTGLFFDYGEENQSRRIARLIVDRRDSEPFEKTEQLAGLVREIVPPKWQVKSLARVFQAIRIEVNAEMDALHAVLVDSYPYLKVGGRMAAIVYHGLESRMVKRFFRGQEPAFKKSNEAFGEKKYFFKNLSSGGIRATEDEIKRNSRAKSAVLRAGEKRES